MSKIAEMSGHDILVQLLGFGAFALFMAAYQVKDTRKTQLLFAPGNLLYGAQYFMLGTMVGSTIMLAAATRDFISAYGSDRTLKICSALYLVFVWTVSLTFSRDWHEYMIAGSGTVSTMALLCRDSFYKFRALLMIRQVLMIFFNIWVKSYGGIIHLCVTLLSNCIGTYRHSRKAKGLDEPA